MHTFNAKYLIQTIFGAAIVFSGFTVACQTTNLAQSISVAQGLSQGFTLSILQDKEGFIWAATDNGLNRYDGYGFKVFTNDPYNKFSLGSNNTSKLFEDGKGRIWIGTANAGINVYDKKSGKFFRIQHDPNDPASLSGNRISIAPEEMTDGRIVVPAQEAGLNIIRLPDDLFENGAKPIITRVNLPRKSQAHGMGKDVNGNVWVASMDSIEYNIDPKTNALSKINEGHYFDKGFANPDGTTWVNGELSLWDGKSFYPLVKDKKIEDHRLGNIIVNPKDKLWLAYDGGLFAFNINKWRPQKPISWNQDMLFNEPSIHLHTFIIDRGGILWAGTKGYGLLKYNTNATKFGSYATGVTVNYIVPVAENNAYLVSYGGPWRDVNKAPVPPGPLHDLLNSNPIDNFIKAKNGNYWLMTDSSKLIELDPSKNKTTSFQLPKNFAEKQPIYEDKKGNIWLPGMDGNLTRITPSTGNISTFSINSDPKNPLLPKLLSTAIYEDETERCFWIGTENGFVRALFDGNAGAQPTITWYKNNPSNRNSLNYNYVSCFLNDPTLPERYLWISTEGGGLNRLDKKTGEFIQVTNANGLPNNAVHCILADHDGNIWGSANLGIFCFSTKKNSTDNNWNIRSFTKADGLQDDEFKIHAAVEMPNGNLAFGSIKGVNIFNPREILQAGFTPNVLITNIQINNQPVLAGDKTGVLKNNIEHTKSITLTHLQDMLTLEFSSLDFTAPEQNKYRYQLAGVDKDWVESGTRRFATYLHLPAGAYTFRVQGSASQGNWSAKIAELQIKVLPPWWLSWEAYAGYLLLLGLCINAYIKFMSNRARLQVQLSFERLETKRIKELDFAKTQFYTNISHEFRTPLTVILGMTQKIAESPAAHLEEGTEMITRNGQSLLKLVNEMLELSKLQSGKMILHPVKGDIIVFLRYIVESFHSLSKNQKKSLHFLSELAHYYTEYDAEKMRQIISNLLSNALKFTVEGDNIYISVSSKEDSVKENTTLLVIKIKDTGIGIPEDKTPFIFDRFYRVENGTTRTTEGAGIGLALTKELVTLMKGEILAKSPPPGVKIGAEFTVELPFKKLSPSDEIIGDMIDQSYFKETQESAVFIEGPTRNNRPQTSVADDKSPLILLVEDNADVAAYTAFCLPGYRLAIAKDGMEGFELAVEIIPDLIISDVMMPRMDGFELLRKIKGSEFTSHIPIIMLTAKADRESRMEGISGGADAYLEKPFNQEELQIRIKKLLELRKILQTFYLQKAGLLSAPHSLNGSNKGVEPIAAEAEDKFVIKVREVVEAHISESEFSLEQLCGEMFMSHSKLHRKISALTGCSPNKFIRIVRLKKAKQLLKDNEISISSVAMDCGFSDPGYFSRVFKQEFGITPNDWRTETGK